MADFIWDQPRASRPTKHIRYHLKRSSKILLRELEAREDRAQGTSRYYPTQKSLGYR